MSTVPTPKTGYETNEEMHVKIIPLLQMSMIHVRGVSDNMFSL